MKIDNLSTRAKEIILKCFEDIPLSIIKAIDVERDFQPDLSFIVQQNDAVKKIIVEVKNNGEPRNARQAVNQLLRYLVQEPEAYGIFVSPYISPRAAVICQEAGIGYIDLAGNCLISFGMIYIQNKGNPNPFTRKKYLRALYSPKAERILRVLLTTGPKEWKTEALAREAEVSLGQVSNVKKLLIEQEWMDSKSVGFSLTNPISLLEDWTVNYKYQRNIVLKFYSLQTVPELEYRLGEVCNKKNIRYGFSGFSGSVRYAPAVRHQRMMAYIQGDIEGIARALEIKPVDSGFNVTLVKPYDEGVFYGAQLIDGSEVVSPIQVFLDLKNIRGRGEEAANTLFDQVIQKIW